MPDLFCNACHRLVAGVCAICGGCVDCCEEDPETGEHPNV